jgi:hypothetical protein
MTDPKLSEASTVDEWLKDPQGNAALTRLVAAAGATKQQHNFWR